MKNGADPSEFIDDFEEIIVGEYARMDGFELNFELEKREEMNMNGAYRNLAYFLKEKKIDEISDDEEFMREEFETVRDYCQRKCFRLDNYDLGIIEGRGLKESYENWRSDYIKSLWEDLGDITIDEDECIETDWGPFKAGTFREDIWHWFEETYHISVAMLMYGYLV